MHHLNKVDDRLDEIISPMVKNFTIQEIRHEIFVFICTWFNRRYCISVKQIHRGEVSYSPKRSFTFTKKTQIISIWYCSDQLPTSVPERVIYLFIIYWFTSLFIYLSIYLFIYLFIYLLYLMSIPREAQKQEKTVSKEV